MKSKHVKISGRGLCGSSGKSVKDFYEGLRSGVSSIKLVKSWEHLPIRMASVIENSDLSSQELAVVQADQGLKRSWMLQTALHEALDSAGLWDGERWSPKSYAELMANQEFSNRIKHLPERVGIFLGVGTYPTTASLVDKVITFNQERGWDHYGQTDFKEVYLNFLNRLNLKHMSEESQLYALNYEQCATAALLRHLLGNQIHGPTVTISNLCVSSLQAVGEAYRAIHSGEVDLAIAGGIEEYSFLSSYSFAALGAYADVHKVENASRPFDRKRQGLVLGEGCGLIVLEKKSRLTARKQAAFAEIKAYAGSNNHHHMTSSPSSGEGLSRAMTKCLKLAGDPTVDLLIAHGTGTLNNDPSETAAIHSTTIGFPWVQSIKSFTGHTLASAGIYNIICGLIQQENGFFSHTLHLDDPDPVCHLNHIQKGGMDYQASTVMINAAGFGGMNACMLLNF